MIINLEHLEFDKKIELTVPGWKKIEIVYAFRMYSGISWLVWKVSDTEHIFEIQHSTVIMNHGTDLKDHFILTLKVFREDYLEWKKQDFSEPWMVSYQHQFENLII